MLTAPISVPVGPLTARPLTLADANALVSRLHRHHRPVVGHRFSIGAEAGGELVGAIIVGRPVARKTDQVRVFEVTRLVTDGTRNACSFLYARAARVAEAMGAASIQTFTLPEEGGGSLRAAGWRLDGEASPPPNGWNSREHAERLELPRARRRYAAVRREGANGTGPEVALGAGVRCPMLTLPARRACLDVYASPARPGGVGDNLRENGTVGDRGGPC